MDGGRRAHAGLRARHGVRPRRVLPQRLLLRRADIVAVGRALPAGFLRGPRVLAARGSIPRNSISRCRAWCCSASCGRCVSGSRPRDSCSGASCSCSRWCASRSTSTRAYEPGGSPDQPRARGHQGEPGDEPGARAVRDPDDPATPPPGGRASVTPPIALAILGDPLAYTQSPVLHRAGLASLGLDGESTALRTPIAALGERLAELARARAVGRQPHRAAQGGGARPSRSGLGSRAARPLRQHRGIRRRWELGRHHRWARLRRSADEPRPRPRPRAVAAARRRRRRPQPRAGDGGRGAPRVSAWARDPVAAAAVWAGIEGAEVLPWRIRGV